MLTDPISAWLIALVVCTIYGWCSYNLGYYAGGRTAVATLTKIIVDANICTVARLQKATEQAWAKANSSDEEP